MSARRPPSSLTPTPPTVKSISLSASGGFIFSRNAYTDCFDFVAPGDQGSLGAPLGDQTLDQVRRAIGRLTHLANGTRPDLAAWVGDFSARLSQLAYQDARALKDLVKMATQTAGELRYSIKSDMCLDKLHLASFDDCASGREDGKSRSRGLLTLSDSFPGSTFQVLPWSSRILRRVAGIALGGSPGRVAK